MVFDAADSLYHSPYIFVIIHVYEIEVIMLVVTMCVFWRKMSFRLVYAFGGGPFLEGSPCRVICS